MRMLGVGGTAAVGAASRRLFHGPARPGWTWSEDLLLAVSRAVLRTSARDLDIMGPGRLAPAPPLSRAARSRLQVEAVDLSGTWAERYCPDVPAAGTILRFHGRGFVSGGPRLERRPAAELALATRCDTYGIRYRLAPQHPYPAALNDAVTAYRALLDRDTDPDRTVLFGGSAGAGLALAALLEIRRLGLPRPAGGVLLWPYADFTFSGTSIDTNGDVDMLPLRDLAHVWGPAYVGDADPTDPLVSPALADLEGLPRFSSSPAVPNACCRAPNRSQRTPPPPKSAGPTHCDVRGAGQARSRRSFHVDSPIRETTMPYRRRSRRRCLHQLSLPRSTSTTPPLLAASTKSPSIDCRHARRSRRVMRCIGATSDCHSHGSWRTRTCCPMAEVEAAAVTSM